MRRVHFHPVYLISHQVYHAVWLRTRAQLLHPAFSVSEGLLLGHVVYHKGADSTSVVPTLDNRNNLTRMLLPYNALAQLNTLSYAIELTRVPDLSLDDALPVPKLYILGGKFYANGGRLVSGQLSFHVSIS